MLKQGLSRTRTKRKRCTNLL